MNEVFLPRDSAIGVLEDKFSKTAMIDQHHFGGIVGTVHTEDMIKPCSIRLVRFV